MVSVSSVKTQARKEPVEQLIYQRWTFLHANTRASNHLAVKTLPCPTVYSTVYSAAKKRRKGPAWSEARFI